jgi:hypothetical protein
MLLKDVLYRREREKVINSKENTQRENEKKLTNITNNSNKSATELRTRISVGKPP